MADIYLIHGSDCSELTDKLLYEADIKSRVPHNAKVVIKPNLVTPTKPEHGATTHVGIVESIVRYLKEHCQVASITIAEGAWIGADTAEAFTVCGYDELVTKYGVILLDTKKDKEAKASAHGVDLSVCNVFLESDYFINVPVLKGHSQTKMTCCLKNLKGCIPDSEKSRYHQTGLHKPIAALTTILKPDLHVIDSICGDPTFEEGGNPVTTNRMLLGFDAVMLDSYCAGLIDVNYLEVKHLCLAKEWGVGRFVTDTSEIVELGVEHKTDVKIVRSELVSYLEEFIDDDNACSACYTGLISALREMIGDMPAEGEIKVGQGYKGKEIDGIGVGNCTAGCTRHLPGCSPSSEDILEFLRKSW